MKHGEIQKLVVMVSEGPYQSLKPYSALRFAEAARRRGVDATIIFFADGIHCVKRAVGRGSSTVADFEAKIRGLIESGVSVEACEAPMRLFGMSAEDLIEGVVVAADVADHIFQDDEEVIWL